MYTYLSSLTHSPEPEFRAKIAIIGFLRSFCGSPVRAYWAELKYNRIVAAWVRALSNDFSKFRKKQNLQYFQVDRDACTEIC